MIDMPRQLRRRRFARHRFGRDAANEKRDPIAVIAATGAAETIAWASSYYLPAILGAPIAVAFGFSPSVVELKTGSKIHRLRAPLIRRSLPRRLAACRIWSPERLGVCPQPIVSL